MEKVLKLVMNSKESPERKDVEYDYHNVPTLPSDAVLAMKEQATADEAGKDASAAQEGAGKAEDVAVAISDESPTSSTGSGESENTEDTVAAGQRIPVVIVSEQQPPPQHLNFNFPRAFQFRMLRRSDDTSNQGSNGMTALERRTCMIETYVISSFIILLVVFCMVLKIYLLMNHVARSTSNDTASTMADFVGYEDTWMDDLEVANTTLALDGTLNATSGTTSIEDILNITSTESGFN